MSWLDTLRLGLELVKDLVHMVKQGVQQPFAKPKDSRRDDIESKFYDELHDREDDRSGGD